MEHGSEATARPLEWKLIPTGDRGDELRLLGNQLRALPGVGAQARTEEATDRSVPCSKSYVTQACLILTAATPGLGAIVTVIGQWLEVRKARSIVIESDLGRLEIKGASSDEQMKALELFAKKHLN